MAKVRVAVSGTVGKSVLIDVDLEPRIIALETSLNALGAKSVSAHRNLTGLSIGDDHPQYTMWQAPEDIQAIWNFTGVPTIGGITLPEYIQDTIGAILTDTSSIDMTYNDGANTISATVITANPTGTIGLAAVNGSAATPMRSDAAPALSQAIAPNWSANHTWLDNAKVQLGTGADLQLYHDGTNSFVANGTGDLNISTVAGNINFTPAGVFPTSGDVFFTRNHNERTRLIVKNTNAGTTAACQFAFNNGGAFGAAFVLSGTGYSGPYLPNMPAGSAAAFYTSGPVGGPLALGTSDIARLVVDGAGVWIKSYCDVWLAEDSDRFIAGAGADLIWTHDGTNSTIRNGTGNLILGTASVDSMIVDASGAASFRSNFLGSYSTSIIGVYLGNQSGSHPSELFVNSGGAADTKLWQHIFTTTQGLYRTVDDAFGTGKNYLAITRAANVITAQDYGNATDLPTHTFNGQVRTTAGTTAAASLRVPHGAAPSAPTNGDIWTTTAGLFVRINGVTVGPLT